MGAENDTVERLARELRALWKLRWDQPNEFGDFSEQPELTKLLGLSGGHRDVERLRKELLRITEDVREEEEKEDGAPAYGRSLAFAWTSLLKLEEKWEGTQLQERQNDIRKKWRTAHGTMIKSHLSVRKNFEPDIYKELAKRLLAGPADVSVTGPRRQPPRTLPQSESPAPAVWPGTGRGPEPGQDVVILIAANAKRRGPASGLIRLVREFAPYWRATEAFLYSLEGSHREIWRAGLLHDYENFITLPAGFYGGLVYATETVVAAAEAERTCHVVYLVDPHDNSSLYPATSSIKRQCILNRTPFLTTYEGAARWFRLDWARRVAEGEGTAARKLLVARPDDGFDEESGLEEECAAIAIAAHDRHKRTVMDFAETHAEQLTRQFPERWATQVTGHLLNGGSIRDQEYENDILYDVKEESRDSVEARIEEKSKEWRDQERKDGPGSTGWVSQLTRGRRGGVIQLARKVLDGECETIIFLEDAETPGDQDMEIQMLDRAAQLADGDCLLLYDQRSAGKWAENIALCADENGTASALTLVEAYRRVFDVELVLADSDPRRAATGGGRRSAKEAESARTWGRITAAAATHLLGLLVTAARSRKEGDEPIRLGLPWGGAINDIIGELPEARQSGGLTGAIGLRRFVEETDGKSRHDRRNHAIAAGQWPPLDEEHLSLFDCEELRVVPTVGVIGASDRSLESHSLIDRAVTILGGVAVPYPESAFAFSGGENSQLGATPADDWEKLDVLLISAAPLRKRPSARQPAALATGLPADLADHYKGCACAVGTFYLEKTDDGVAERSHPAYTQVGISMAQIQHLKESGAEVILANGAETGTGRRHATWAALRAGFVSTFVTDEDFAWAVLQEEIAELKPPGRRR